MGEHQEEDGTVALEGCALLVELFFLNLLPLLDLLPLWTVDCDVELLQCTELRAGRAEDAKLGPRVGYPLTDLLLDSTIRTNKSCA